MKSTTLCDYFLQISKLGFTLLLVKKTLFSRWKSNCVLLLLSSNTGKTIKCIPLFSINLQDFKAKTFSSFLHVFPHLSYLEWCAVTICTFCLSFLILWLEYLAFFMLYTLRFLDVYSFAPVLLRWSPSWNKTFGYSSILLYKFNIFFGMFRIAKNS